MASTPKPYVVVVGIDFSEIADLALQTAFERASDHENGEVHVIYVARSYEQRVLVDAPNEVLTMSMDEASQRVRVHLEARLAYFMTTRGTRPAFARAVTHLRVDDAAREIAQLASDLEADLIVVGTHGRRGIRRLVLGSVAEATVRLAPCDVLVVRPRGEATEPRIEPPCPACVKARTESNGAIMWCDVHGEHHGRRHTYNFVTRMNRSREALPGLGSND
jgi:nucleotide-binding universal stress UspA family protein